MNVELGSLLFLFKDRRQATLPISNSAAELRFGGILLGASCKGPQVGPAQLLKGLALDVGGVCLGCASVTM